MEITTLGKTGLKVTRLGVGQSEIGGFRLTTNNTEEVGRLLNTALDGGINFFDTSACYGNSEELVGRAVSHRREEYILATKCGHITGGYEGRAWTAKTITDSIDRSLVRLRTDHLDLVQLHSCGVVILERGEAIEALLDAKRAGKTRFVGYSGDNKAAHWAVDSGLFDTLQTSFNLVDQQARTKLFRPAKTKGMGIIVKRPIANGAWGAKRKPSGYAANYFGRAQVMAQMGPISSEPEDRILTAMGFLFSHPEVHTAIVGTKNPAHMMANIELVGKQLPIPAEVVNELHRRFDEKGAEWLQLT